MIPIISNQPTPIIKELNLPIALNSSVSLIKIYELLNKGDVNFIVKEDNHYSRGGMRVGNSDTYQNIFIIPPNSGDESKDREYTRIYHNHNLSCREKEVTFSNQEQTIIIPGSIQEIADAIKKIRALYISMPI